MGGEYFACQSQVLKRGKYMNAFYFISYNELNTSIKCTFFCLFFKLQFCSHCIMKYSDFDKERGYIFRVNVQLSWSRIWAHLVVYNLSKKLTLTYHHYTNLSLLILIILNMWFSPIWSHSVLLTWSPGSYFSLFFLWVQWSKLLSEVLASKSFLQWFI